MKKIIKNLFGYGFIQGASIVLNLVTVSFLLISLNIQEIGYLGIYQSITTILPRVIGLGSTSYIVSQTVKQSPLILRRKLSVLVIYMIITSTLLIILAGLNGIFFKTQTIALVIFIGVISSAQLGFANLQTSFLVQSSKIYTISILKIGYLASVLIFTIIIFETLGASLENRLFTILVLDTVFIIYRVSRFRNFIRILPKTKFLNNLWELTRYGIPIIVSACFGWIFFDLDKILLAKYFDMAAVGLLTSAIWAGSLLNTFNDILRQSFIPSFRNWCKTKYTFHGYSIIYGVHTTILSMLAYVLYETIRLLSAYHDTAAEILNNELLPLTLIFYVIFGIFFTSATLLEYYSMSKIRMYYLMLFSILKIFLTYIVVQTSPDIKLIYMTTLLSYFLFVLMINTTIKIRIKDQC